LARGAKNFFQLGPNLKAQRRFGVANNNILLSTRNFLPQIVKLARFAPITIQRQTGRSRQPWGNPVPRLSKAALTIARLSADRRLECPPELGGVEAEIFRQTIASMPIRHFAAEDSVLLCAYCRAAALERHAAEELAARATVGDQPSPWLAVRDRSVLTMLRLAVRLRLGPRARDHNVRVRAVKEGTARQPSYYELMGRER
jgi:phage terminase small subunit